MCRDSAVLTSLRSSSYHCGARTEESLIETSDHRVLFMICVVCLFLFQKIKVTVVWTCTLVISLFLESCHAHKVKLTSYSHFFLFCFLYQNKLLSSLSPQLNIHWGPQSMMYLKGKREFNHKAVKWTELNSFEPVDHVNMHHPLKSNPQISSKCISFIEKICCLLHQLSVPLLLVTVKCNTELSLVQGDIFCKFVNFVRSSVDF